MILQQQQQKKKIRKKHNSNWKHILDHPYIIESNNLSARN